MQQEQTITVTAVMPVYNGGVFIDEAIRSLSAQTFPLLELIVVDDGSKDGTPDRVRALQDALRERLAVRLIVHAENRGVSASRNEAIAQAQGTWILFLDADDILHPTLLEKQVGRLRTLEAARPEPEAYVLVHSAYQQIAQDGQPVGQPFRSRQTEPEEMFGYELVRNEFALSGTMIRRSTAMRIGAFDPELRYSEDWDLWLRLAQVGGYGYVDEPLVQLRRHTGNASRRLQTLLDAERSILGRYESAVLREAVHRRRLPFLDNELDYVQLLFRIDRWTEGQRHLQALLEQGESDARLHFWVGIYGLKQEQWAEAEARFAKVKELQPGHGAAWNNTGALALLRGDEAEARGCLAEALQLFPGYMDAEWNWKRLEAGGAQPQPGELKFTWRELRRQLTLYAE